MQEKIQEIVSLLRPNRLLIGYGSGSSTKTRLLLDALDALDAPAGYVPIDIAKDQLLRSAADLASAYPAQDWWNSPNHWVIVPLPSSWSFTCGKGRVAGSWTIAPCWAGSKIAPCAGQISLCVAWS